MKDRCTEHVIDHKEIRQRRCRRPAEISLSRRTHICRQHAHTRLRNAKKYVARLEALLEKDP